MTTGLEVAIRATEAVFDWKEYLKDNFDYVPSGAEEGWLDDDEDEELDPSAVDAMMADIEESSKQALAEMDEEDLSDESGEM